MPRAKAFSGALKKKQLQEKRARQQQKAEDRIQQERGHDPSASASTNAIFGGGHVVKNFSKEFRPETSGARSKESSNNRRRPIGREASNLPEGQKLRSVFVRRSHAEIEKSRLESMKPLHMVPESDLEVSFEDFFPKVIDLPKRPQWDYSMSREQVEKNEKAMFEAWIDNIYDNYPAEELSYFEHNLEVWRQLWRVLEISDIIMIIVDIRHPVIHFPPSLYRYVVEQLKRKLVVVFNKVDLVAESTLFAWTHYFQEQFPELHIASFSCYPRDPNLINDASTSAIARKVKRPRKRFYNAVGVREVLSACRDVELSKHGDLVDWNGLIAAHDKKTAEEADEETDDDDDEESVHGGDEGEESNSSKGSSSPREDQDLSSKMQAVDLDEDERAPHKDFITIGLVGHPNVGKSSLINSIMGRTVVSTSRTPGHTKHFQTIYLTHNVRLCDSPGLVFPSLIPKSLQILSGMFPVAQVQEPYSVVGFLAERVHVPRLLRLDPPPHYDMGPFRWSAFAICESYALQRGFLTARTGTPDVYRAANAILRLSNDGRILLSFKPPGYFTSTKYEKLRVAAADALLEEEEEVAAEKDDEEEGESGHGSGKNRKPSRGVYHQHMDDRKSRRRRTRSGEEDEEEEEEEEAAQVSYTDLVGAKRPAFQVNSRVGGFFGLLGNDDGEEDDEEQHEGADHDGDDTESDGDEQEDK
ncbi:Guanine nucleotide-binding-like protein 1 [Actinomortierella ambigua]|uniref:Guanine nucleotide-binding protein-like 1 n=1 Tax=Actinomortierella ambigua TaxID=1343610 RepID=A0A9P6Q5Z9_9FUNG|nr:Guanine nucleotide-binding-like protein 1 [Actinomortierella ambigua]